MSSEPLHSRRPRVVVAGVLGVLAALAILAYLRSVQLPFISDDYYQITLAWKYGSADHWRDLILDPLYRCRATSIVLTYWTWRLFDLNPLSYKWSSILVHVFNTWLILGLGAWRLVGWRRAAIAAAFFAVYEGHQEAVIWYAALPELLVFTFVLLSFLFWVAWLQSGCCRDRYYWATVTAFVLALASKESSVVAVPLMAAAVLAERSAWRKALVALVPMGVMTAVYALFIHASRSQHLFYHDGTFSLSASFLNTMMISTGRLFWFWGLAGVVVLLALRPWRWPRSIAWPLIWIGITFLPYSFLTYMPRVPSRHTYMASAGLALVVASAALALRARIGRVHPLAVAALATVLVIHNCAYIWTRKHQQYLQRAAATESLVRLSQTPGPIYLSCFPYGEDIAKATLEVVDGGHHRDLVIGAESPCLSSP